MIGISKLYCGTVESSDALLYGRQSKRLSSHYLHLWSDHKLPSISEIETEYFSLMSLQALTRKLVK